MKNIGPHWRENEVNRLSGTFIKSIPLCEHTGNPLSLRFFDLRHIYIYIYTHRHTRENRRATQNYFNYFTCRRAQYVHVTRRE